MNKSFLFLMAIPLTLNFSGCDNSSHLPDSGQVTVQSKTSLESIAQFNVPTEYHLEDPQILKISETSPKVFIIQPNEIGVFDLSTETWVWNRKESGRKTHFQVRNLNLEKDSFVLFSTGRPHQVLKLSTGEVLSTLPSQYGVQLWYPTFLEGYADGFLNFANRIIYDNFWSANFDKKNTLSFFIEGQYFSTPCPECVNQSGTSTFTSASGQSYFIDVAPMSRNKILYGVDLKTKTPLRFEVATPAPNSEERYSFSKTNELLTLRYSKGSSSLASEEWIKFFDFDKHLLSRPFTNIYSKHLATIETKYQLGSLKRRKIALYSTLNWEKPFAEVDMLDSAQGWTYYSRSTDELFFAMTDAEKSFFGIYNLETKSTNTWMDSPNADFVTDEKMSFILMKDLNFSSGHLGYTIDGDLVIPGSRSFSTLDMKTMNIKARFNYLREEISDYSSDKKYLVSAFNSPNKDDSHLLVRLHDRNTGEEKWTKKIQKLEPDSFHEVAFLGNNFVVVSLRSRKDFFKPMNLVQFSIIDMKDGSIVEKVALKGAFTESISTTGKSFLSWNNQLYWLTFGNFYKFKLK